MASSLVLLCLVFVVLCSLLTLTECLKKNDTGVCEIQRSERKTRRLNYRVVINKWCGKKKCTVPKSKVQTYSVSKNIAVCCKGFQYQSDTDTCLPLCSTGCSGGRCIDPDVCECAPPAVFDGNGACVTCNLPCFNGSCIANNTCRCYSNYTSYNQTHCFHCEAGFEVNQDLECVPKCAKPCINARCTAPDECTCLRGYAERDESTCDPQCDLCVNGACVAPNLCECDHGYITGNATHCTPKCDMCLNGTCVEPNVCRCDVGYNVTDSGCVPVCDSDCRNGSCSEPNVCECYDGYRNVDNDTSKACVKIAQEAVNSTEECASGSRQVL